MNVTEAALNKFGRIGRKTGKNWMYWSVYHPFNFGDWIGPFLYKQMTGKDAWFSSPSNIGRTTINMSAGSIMAKVKGNCVVWGSGILRRNEEIEKPWEIRAVRGPYTKERCDELKIHCPEIYGDPGLLLPDFYEPTASRTRHTLGVIPHFTDFQEIFNKFDGLEGVKVVDVRYPIEKVIDCIASCDAVVSSSLHGLIVSNAYGIPAGWVSFGGALSGDNVKFYDYYGSLNCFNPEKFESAERASMSSLVDFARSQNVLAIKSTVDKLAKCCPFI